MNGNQMEHAQKTAAAIAAVLQYIKTEEEAIAMQNAMQAAASQMPRFAPPQAPAVKPWGVSGRQTQMQMRNLMQLRTFRKL
jgi:predicted RNA polymerase sigma factor